MMEVLKNVTQLKVFSIVVYTLLTIVSCSKDDDIKTNDRDQFLGTYTVVYCGFDNTYSNIISAVETHENRISFTDFANEDSVEQPYGIVTGNTIEIPNQTYNANASGTQTITVQGSGSISGNIVTIDYTLNGSLNCTDVYTKQ